MFKILISSCLLGEKVRYNGLVIDEISPVIRDWVEAGIVVPYCPEVSGGLETPREPAEIQGGDGYDVLNGKCKVVDKAGTDVTVHFVRGGTLALEVAVKEQVRYALLKENSPSCGSNFIYDGTFSGVKQKGVGTTSAILIRGGIKVYSEADIEVLEKEINKSLGEKTKC